MTDRPLRVLFLARYPVEGASSRYRVYQYLPHLAALGVECEVQSFMDTPMYRLSTQPGRTFSKILATLRAFGRRLAALRHWRAHDIIFMQRELFPFGPLLVERWLRWRGAVLIFDLDDALFIKKASRHTPLATLLRSAPRVNTLFRLVDCTLAGNDWLRDAARAQGGRAVTLEVAEDTARIPMHARHCNDRPVTIGWLGSPSTVKYLHLIAPVLRDLAARNPDLRFEIMGGGDFVMDGVPWHLSDWSLEGELAALARFDIGLMPLPSEDWARGKSGGKARTYMAAGVVPVCTAIGYNLELIRPGETGFLCSDDAGWRAALGTLIADADLRQKIASAARDEIETRFAPAGQAALMQTVLHETLAARHERRIEGPPAVVMGLSPTGLHVVRTLGRAGVRVTGVSSGLSAGQGSRYLSDRIVEPDPQRLLERLRRRFPVPLRPEDRCVLIPTSDQDVDFVIRHADVLAAHFAFQRSYVDGVAAQLMDKASFYALCDRHDVVYPKLRQATQARIGGLRDEIRYPCLIKPARIQDVKAGMAGKKGWILRDATEFDRVIPRLPPEAGVLLVQDIVPGAESEITVVCGYFAEGGRMNQPFTARKLRQYPPGFGSASLVQSAPEAESRAIAERFLAALGYRGIAAAEFKRDPATGLLSIIEINVRPSLWFSLSDAAAKPVVLAAYRDLAGLPRLPEMAQRDGVRWRYGSRDLWSALFYRFKRGFILPPPDTTAVGPARARVAAVFAWDDPVPVFSELAALAVKFARRFRRRFNGL